MTSAGHHSKSNGLRVRGTNTVNWEGARKYLLDNRGSLHNTYTGMCIVLGLVRFTSMRQLRKE